MSVTSQDLKVLNHLLLYGSVMIFLRYVMFLLIIILLNFLKSNIIDCVPNGDTYTVNYEFATFNNVIPNEDFVNQLATVPVIFQFYEYLDSQSKIQEKAAPCKGNAKQQPTKGAASSHAQNTQQPESAQSDLQRSLVG